ncbi:MAG: 2-amino-4-hydroxy-6-hydroxymethyldihydropteridine diphosphokinase [Gammaproteobacteria bacterium]|jgi:2-amino-4-hydroxy-6-hydroxymethyldihydropteridine diphosphokinase|nr:2-amino-4-hydroxy-6-hydroxymethyldihydropteridine diphosphokinase [Gammaproteobacteria bacterium]
MATVYLSLGTNLGDRAYNLERAVTRLTEVLDALVLSSVYETDPWGLVDQPDFYNLCALGETTLEPRALLRLLKHLERALGRVDGTLWGPRLIDIDLLFYDDQVLDEPALQVPHPRIRGRAFVLIPLLDLVEDLEHPALKRSIRSLASEVDATTVRRLAQPLLAASAACDQASEPSATQSLGINGQSCTGVQSCTGSETSRSSNRVLLQSIEQGVTAETQQVCRMRAIAAGAR